MLPKLKVGLLLFYKYARPCLEHLEFTKKINPDDAEKIQEISEEKIEPSKSILKRCFKEAVSNYKKSCKKDGFEANFSPESVGNYWQHRHGHTGDCAVRIVTIVMIDEIGRIFATCDGKQIPVLNPYKLELGFGKSFFIHRSTIVEQAE